ncbi:MAG: hypothetical protein K5871_12510 [Lachnospiraceae bacterium]|nr:hypothetical protein [Lachnospiraceae bacterium]
MSRHKKKNKNNSQKAGYPEESKVLAEEETSSGEEAVSEESDVSTEDSDPAESAASDDVESTAFEEGEVAAESAESEEGDVTEEAADPEEGDVSEENPEAGETAEAEETADTEEASELSEEEASEETAASEEEDTQEPEEKSSGEKSKKESSDEDDASDDEDRKKKAKVSREALREQSETERIRREARHRRRIRQQVTAYLILILIIAVLGCGIYFVAKFFVDAAKQRQADAIAAEEALQRQLEEEAAAQQPVVTEEPPAATVEDLGPTPAERLDEVIESEIAEMTLEEKVQAIMFITPESITGVDRVVIAGEGTAAALSDFCPGGIVYNSRNVTSADQFATMMETTQTLVSRPVFLATTETGLNESGLVGTTIIEQVLTPAQAAQTGNVEDAVNVGMTIGSGLYSIGITVNFAPLADLSVTNGGVMANASYGDDAAGATPYVTGMADGLLQSGVIPAYKYFPSLAASSQNPLNGRAVSDRTLDDFRNNEFQVWLSAINAGAMMIQMSNVIYPSIDSDSLPSSLSEKTVTGVLRDELGYDGVIISGPLNDAAITSYYTASESAVMALKAGCDMIYASPDPRAAANGIIEAVGSGVISEERINDALVRIYRIRYADALEQYRAEYEANAITMGVDLTGVQY